MIKGVILQKRVPRMREAMRGTVYEEVNACAYALRSARNACASRAKARS